MDLIECQWCKAQNEPGRTTCATCGAPLDEQCKVTDAGWTDVPQIRDLTQFGFSNSTCQIDGEIVPVAELALAEGDAVFFEHHVVLWKEPGLAISLMDAGGGIQRMVGGMPRILNVAGVPGGSPSPATPPASSSSYPSDRAWRSMSAGTPSSPAPLPSTTRSSA